MMKDLSLILLLILGFWNLPFITYASESSGSFSAPDFCKYYDNIYEIKYGNSTQVNGRPYVETTEVFGQCISDQYVGVDVKDILDNWSNINDSFLSNYSVEIRNRANNFALNSLLTKAFEFEGLGGAKVVENSNKMLLCLSNFHPDVHERISLDRNKEIKKNKENTENYLNSSFDKSILITTLFSLREDIEKRYDNKKQAYVKGSTRSLRKKAKYSIGMEKIKSAKSKELEKINNALKSLSVNSPLLFSTENDYSITDWFNSKISPSKLTKKLAGNLPSSLLNKFKKSLDKQNSSSIDLDVFSKKYKSTESNEKLQKYKKSHFDKNRKSIIGELKKSSSKFVKNVYESIGDNCIDDGKYLHYNDHIVSSLAEKVFNNNKLSPEDKKIELMSLQAWQCKEWRDNPPARIGETTWTRIGGMASMGAGAVLWATAGWTGIGAVAGTWMIAGGGSLMTGESVRDYIASKPEYQQEKTAFSLGWRDIESLANSKDRRRDIGIDITSDSLGGAAGLTLRFVKLPGKFLQVGTVAENTAKRESSNPISDINEYTNLIFSRHDLVIPEVRYIDKLNNGLRKVTGNVDIPKIMLNAEDDFAPMLRQVTSTKGLPEDRDIAFKDLENLIDKYKAYPTRVRTAVINGRNAKEIKEFNNVYGSILKKEHFEINRKTGKYPELPELDIPFTPGEEFPYKLVRTKNDSIALYYKIVKNENGVDKIVDHVEDFSDYNSFLTFVKNTRKDYSRAFSFDMKDEVLRRSNIFSELDDQAKIYKELEIVRSQLIKEGKNVDLLTGKYPNLSDRQNDKISELNDILNNHASLLPRKDALHAFSLAENKVERKALVLGNIIKNKGTKYSDDAMGMVNDKAPSLLRKFAPVAIVPGMSAISVATSSVLNKTGLKGLELDILEKSREASRAMSRVINPNAPIGFTGDEEECAKSARGWSLENACLLSLLNNNIMGKAGIKEQLDPDYNMAEDMALMSDVRNYIRDIYRLRKYFAEGKKTQISQSSMSIVGKEVAEEELVKFMRETALENGLSLLDSEFLQDDVANKYRQRLFAYKDNPVDAKKAYDDVLKEFSSYQSTFIQNPEMSVSFKQKIKVMMVEQAKMDSKSNK